MFALLDREIVEGLMRYAYRMHILSSVAPQTPKIERQTKQWGEAAVLIGTELKYVHFYSDQRLKAALDAEAEIVIQAIEYTNKKGDGA